MAVTGERRYITVRADSPNRVVGRIRHVDGAARVDRDAGRRVEPGAGTGAVTEAALAARNCRYDTFGRDTADALGVAGISDHHRSICGKGDAKRIREPCVVAVAVDAAWHAVTGEHHYSCRPVAFERTGRRRVRQPPPAKRCRDSSN